MKYYNLARFSGSSQVPKQILRTETDDFLACHPKTQSKVRQELADEMPNDHETPGLVRCGSVGMPKVEGNSHPPL